MMDLRLLAVAAGLALLLGLMLMLLGRGLRRRRGLGEGRTVALDNVTLRRVDRLLRTGNTVIPEEWKSAPVFRPWHRADGRVFPADRGSAGGEAALRLRRDRRWQAAPH